MLLLLPALALFAAGFMGCSQQRRWNHEQRKEMREALRSYRQMAYLEDLDDAEFMVFTDGVTETLEGDYPVYATFIQMPGVDDTVEMVVVTTIVDELNADAHNMRHIYPMLTSFLRECCPQGSITSSKDLSTTASHRR